MFDRLQQYQGNVTSHDVLKAVAGVTMIIDHVGSCFILEPWLRVIGRTAAPCYFFLIGYALSAKLPRDWIIYGIWLSIFQTMREIWFVANILLNFFLIRFTFRFIDPAKLPIWQLGIFGAALVLGTSLEANILEYGFVGWLWAVAGRLVRQQKMFPAGVFLALAALLHGVTTFNVFTNIEGPLQTTVVWIVFTCCAAVFFRFRSRDWTVPESLRAPALFLSRYSLEVYVWHLGVFSTLFFLLIPFR